MPVKPAASLVVKGEWFRLLRDGKKDAEYRHDTDYWERRLWHLREGERIEFRHGYGAKAERCVRVIAGTSVVDEDKLPPDVWNELFNTKGGRSPYQARVIVIHLVPLGAAPQLRMALDAAAMR